MNWTQLNEAKVLANFPSDIQPAYTSWVVANPPKATRAGELAASTAAEFRAALTSNSANILDPDPLAIPDSCLRHALNIIYGQLALEMGINLTSERQQSVTRADIFLRQISYGHFQVNAASGGGQPTSPSWTIPTSNRRVPTVKVYPRVEVPITPPASPTPPAIDTGTLVTDAELEARLSNRIAFVVENGVIKILLDGAEVASLP